MRTIFAGLSLAVWLICAPGFADDAGVPPAASSSQPAPANQPTPVPPRTPVAPDNSIMAFVASHPDCTAITDECVICAVADGKPMCSAPGISCVRSDVRCTSPAPEAPKQ